MRFTKILMSLTCALTTVRVLADDDALRIGPLRFGMSLEEAPREVPTTSWRTLKKSEHSGAVTAIRATDTFEIGGIPFLAEIYAPRLGDYKLRYVRVWEAENARECETAAGRVVAELEPQVGAFAGPAVASMQGGSLGWSTSRTPGGTVVATPRPVPGSPTGKSTVKAGKLSTLSVTAEAYGHKPFTGGAKQDPAHLNVQSRARIERDPPIELEVRATYERLDNGRCGLELTATRAAATRPAEVYPMAPDKIVGTASMSSRNRALRRMVDLPPAGLELTFNCKVRRSDGNVDFCRPMREEDKQYEAALFAARSQAMAIQLDVKGYDPDDPVDLDVTIPIRLSRADIRAPNFDSHCRLEDESVPWVRQPQQYDGDYPESVRKKKLTASIDVGCEIQSDGSLVCALAPGATPLAHADFLEPALTVVERGSVAREANGRPTVGCTLRHLVTFGPK